MIKKRTWEWTREGGKKGRRLQLGRWKGKQEVAGWGNSGWSILGQGTGRHYISYSGDTLAWRAAVLSRVTGFGRVKRVLPVTSILLNTALSPVFTLR